MRRRTECSRAQPELDTVQAVALVLLVLRYMGYQFRLGKELTCISGVFPMVACCRATSVMLRCYSLLCVQKLWPVPKSAHAKRPIACATVLTLNILKLRADSWLWTEATHMV